MTTDLLKHSIRALKKQKAYVLINVLGLAIGLSASMMIALFIINELSFDQYHENKQEIFKLIHHGRISGDENLIALSPPPMGAAMHEQIPGIRSFLRIFPRGEAILGRGDVFFVEDHFIEADSTFFAFFSFPLLQGDPHTALKEPFSVVLSKSTAHKIFGESDPLDQLLTISPVSTPYRVTGVMADIPLNTHFKAQVVGSFSTSPASRSMQWMANNFHTYLLLEADADAARVQEQIPAFVARNVGPEIQRYTGTSLEEYQAMGYIYNYLLQPLTSIRLDPAIGGTILRATDPRYFRIFGGIGLLILVVAAINFMNLSTAQAGRRAREVGIKKVSGSTRQMLIGQFLTETVVLALLAMVLAFFITELSLPWFNQMLDLNLNLQAIGLIHFLPVLFVAALIIGVLAGSYPAFYLSAFQPGQVLKGKVSQSRSSIRLRAGLTVLQFAISIILITGSMVMHRQIRYMLSKDLGFDKEHVMVIRRAALLRGRMEPFKQELQQLPGVISAAASTAVPGSILSNSAFMMRGRPEDTYILQAFWVDRDFPQTYGLKLAEGRLFDSSAGDYHSSLVNERTLRNFGITEPFSTHFMHLASEGSSGSPVIGVVHDFHATSLRQEILPSILILMEDNISWSFLSVKLAPGAQASTIDQIRKVWNGFVPESPLLYYFLDEDLQSLYTQERQTAGMSVTFTILAIIIASLGLYGLIAFAVNQRIKEIGVRKTFGASAASIWLMICREIFVLIALATLIAWPVVYYVGSNWLANYHYRSSLSPWDFLAALAIATLIAVLTISYRTLKTARMNPSVSLRYE